MKRVAIVGRGIIGMSIAHKLWQRGYQVGLFGPQRNADTASYCAIGVSCMKGLRFPHTDVFAAKMSGHYGLAAWLKQLEKDAETSINYAFSGVFEPFYSADDYQAIARRVYHRQFRGINSTMLLTHSELREQSTLPVLDSVYGALFYPEDGWYDPESVLQSLNRFAKINHLIVSEDEVQHLEDIDQSYDSVVLAAGSATRTIAEISGIDLPEIFLSPGHILVGSLTESGSGAFVRFNRSALVFDRTFRYGSLKDDSVTTKEEFLRDVKRVLPVSDVSTLYGVRCRTKNRTPIIARYTSGGRPLVVATAFYKSGFQLAQYAASRCLELLER